MSDMDAMLEAVKAFHLKNGFELGGRVPKRPELSSYAWELKEIANELQRRCEHKYDSAIFRIQLLIGELAEIVEAVSAGDELATLDGFVDLLYVLLGGVLQWNLPLEEGFKEVHRSNMTKDRKYGVAARWKGPDYVAPDLKSVLERSRRDGI